jgi:hypothetical protein
MNCPISECRTSLCHHQLVCDWHWRRLPRQVRDELRALHHTQPGSPRELAAVSAALDYLTERQGQRQLQGVTP